jgi:hypothetical protein
MVSPRNGQPDLPGGRLNLVFLFLLFKRIKKRRRDKSDGRRRRGKRV